MPLVCGGIWLRRGERFLRKKRWFFLRLGWGVRLRSYCWRKRRGRPWQNKNRWEKFWEKIRKSESTWTQTRFNGWSLQRTTWDRPNCFAAGNCIRPRLKKSLQRKRTDNAVCHQRRQSAIVLSLRRKPQPSGAGALPFDRH